METEIMQTVLNEVLEELKELKQQVAKLMAVMADLNNKVDDFEIKLSNIKVSAPPTNLEPITSTVKEGIFRLRGVIEEQPKSIIRQY
jgi:predicted  nucleic acid-binding Zn-ribbon protein